MKFLVPLLFAAGALAAPKAITNDYELPLAPVVPAPIQTITIPQGPTVIPAGRVLVNQAPFVPAPVQLVHQPIAPVRIAAPAPIPAPVAVPTPVAVPAPVAVAAAPVPVAAPVPIPASVNTQFHAQDELGGVNFGYQNDLSSRQEIRTPDGVTRGAYSYVDANGIVQHVEYTADAINGFRVAATNLPVVADAQVAAAPIALAPAPVQVTPEVAAATEAHLRAVAEAQALVTRKKRSSDYKVPAAPVVSVAPVILPAPIPAPVPVPAPTVSVVRQVVAQQPAILPAHIAQPALLPAPVRVAPAPVAVPAPIAQPALLPAPARVAPAPVAVPAPVPTPLAAPVPVASPVNTQFHAQDELGGVNFGYQNANSARQEVRTPDGVTRGAYSYVDANGIVQNVEYIADPVNGFRVAATNLPTVATAAAGPVALASPVPVQVTPEVAAATAAHLKAVAEAQALAA